MRGRGEVVMDTLRERDRNFHPDEWLMKHDHVRDSIQDFHPIDLIHKSPKVNYGTSGN